MRMSLLRKARPSHGLQRVRDVPAGEKRVGLFWMRRSQA